MLKTWTEDFVDEDTGEVVTIERNEVVIDRETELTEEHIEQILNSDVNSILLHKEDANTSDYSIIFNTLRRMAPTPRKKPSSTSTGSCATRSRRTMQVPERLSTTCSSPRSATTSAKWAATASTASLI